MAEHDAEGVDSWTKFVYSIAQELESVDVKRMKFLCTFLPTGVLEDVNDSLDLFERLIKANKMTEENLSFLSELVKIVGRKDLEQRIGEYESAKKEQKRLGTEISRNVAESKATPLSLPHGSHVETDGVPRVHTDSTQHALEEEAIRTDGPVSDRGFKTCNVQGEEDNLPEAKHLLDFDPGEVRKKQCWKRGAFSKIYCESIKGTHYAIKEIEAWDEDHKKVIEKEEKAFAKITGCENIVTFYGAKWDGLYCYLLLEKCLCNLETAIKEKTPLEPKVVLTDMCKGLHFLHLHDIVHKDIKPTNVLLVQGKEDGKLRAKLADFGASVHLPDHSSATLTGSGTDGWRAPESGKEGGRLRFSYDVFCLGLVYYYTATKGKHLFESQAAIWKENPPNYDALTELTEKRDEPRDSLSPFESASLLSLVIRMLSFKPDQRCDMSYVKKHCFFWDLAKIEKFFHNIWCDAESDEGLQRLSILDNKEWAEEWAEGKWKTKLDNDKLKADADGRKNLKLTGVTGFIRFTRNKVAHWRDDVERKKLPLPYASERSALEYFLNCYPDLLSRVYEVSVDEIPQYLTV
ncbi:uncharacterized protein [Oscarella lobularis]|uniref:uncharacterized protein n=1 Tax=Oscarella lobularis TaxID=121494 RepID=UPI0033134977